MKLRTLLFLLLLSLGLTGVSRATNLTLEGPCVFSIGPSATYNTTCNQVAITWGRINNLDPTLSGAISLELWALIPNTTQGYKMATYSDGTTISGNSYLASSTIKPALTQPPNGTYCVRLYLKESGIVRSWYDFLNFSGGCTTIQLGNIQFNGPASWQQTGSSVTLGIPQIVNYSAGGISGSLRVQLFATDMPFAPESAMNPAPGILMATYSYPSPGQLCGARYVFAATTQAVPFTLPAAGTYFSTMVLTETVPGGRELKSYINFPNSFTVGSAPATVATPVFNLVAGTYNACVDITLSTITAGAAIRYTLDGTDPVSTSPLYSSVIRLTSSKTVKARAFLSGSTDSAVATAAYVVNAATVATPVISPAGGTFTSGTEATLTCSTSGAEIRYTTDGSTPTVTSLLYTGAITITSTTTLKARAFRECWADSAVASAVFSINIPSTVGFPLISPPGGTFTGNTQVSISVLPADATIRYTTDGTVPTAASPVYTTPFTVITTTTVLARGFKSGWTSSPVASATFTLPSQQTVSAPTFSPAAGNYSGSVTVTLSTTTPGATIYYTTNGSTPTASSTPYTEPFSLTATSTVKAIAVKPSWTTSSMATANYTVTPAQTVATPVVTPGGGSWPCKARVTMSTATSGATIYYTLDGPDPNEGFNSAAYTRPFTIYETLTVRARAFKAGYSPSAVVTVPITITACPSSPVRADCAWDVKEYRMISGSLNSLADAEAALAGTLGVAVKTEYQAAVINHHDPENPGGGGFFTGDLPFAWNNQTASGLINGDDNGLLIHARSTIVITAEDDYTFGFSSDDGARLRIEGAVFTSSTRLNANNPANPAHNGNTLSYPVATSNSQTLGVCHLVPGTYTLDFLCWEGGGGAYAEIFAARGARTAMDSTFRLVGHVPSGMAGNSARLAAPGWQVTQLLQNATDFTAARTMLYNWWNAGTTVTGIRFTSANDFPERDPAYFLLEGTNTPGGSGPWTLLHGGPTNLSTSRGTTTARISVSNTLPWAAYRITFPYVRDSAAAGSMQIAEVQLYDAAGIRMTLTGGNAANSTAIPSSTNSPAAEGAEKAIDGLASTKYLNFDKLNTGFVLLPASSIYPWVNFADPQGGTPGHPGTSYPFPADTTADDNFFALGARASLVITTPGEYTFCLYADDGVSLRIKGTRNWTVTSPNAAQSQPQAQPDGMQSNNCCADVFGTVYLAAGTYDVELIHNEITVGANVGLWHAFGRHTAFSPLAFSLVGENAGTTSADTAPFALKTPTVVQPPFNDDFAAAGYIDVPAARLTACNVGAIREPGEPLSGATGNSDFFDHSLWWTWVAQETGLVQIDTIGSDFDTLLDIYTGDTLTSLIRVQRDDQSGGNNTSALFYQATAQTRYKIRVSGYTGIGTGGAQGRCRLNITPLPAPPANDAFAQATWVGSARSFSVSGNPVAATAEPDEATSFSFPATVWYSWDAPLTGDFILEATAGSTTPIVSVFTGNTLATLYPVEAQGPPNRKRFTARAGVTYRILLANRSFQTHFTLTLVPVPAVTAFGLTGTGAARKFDLTWQSEPFTTYHIEESTDLTTWTTTIPWAGTTGYQTSLSLPSPATTAPKRFYRILRE